VPASEEAEMGEVRTWSVTLDVFDHQDSTTARAVLRTAAGSTTGRGQARRNPHDVAVPEIGQEIAVARALRDLADRLLGAASDDIAEVQHEEVHLRR
jgi:hypothetical protein